MSKIETDRVNITIKAMRIADIDWVLRIEKDCFPDPWPRSAFEDIVKSRDHGAVVAVVDEKLVAYGCYLIVGHEAHLTNLAVTPKFRRKRVAKQILEHILEVAERKECEYILLEVRPRNESATAFYENSGFRLLYRRPRYYRNPVEDALVMVYYFNRNES